MRCILEQLQQAAVTTLLVLVSLPDQPVAYRNPGFLLTSRSNLDAPIRAQETSNGRYVQLESPPLPWQQPQDYVQPGAKHVNDIRALIESQRQPGVKWLTVFSLTGFVEGSHEFQLLLNTITSYLILGGGRSYIVAVAKQEGLEACMRLRLPCYNATASVRPEHLSSYIGGTWAKVLIVRDILKALPPGLNLHYSDHDVVYMKQLYPTLDRFMEVQDFDIAGQVEDLPVLGINTGVLFGRNTPRLHKMYDAWVSLANLAKHDQETFMRSISNIATPLPVGKGSDAAKALQADPNGLAGFTRFRSPWLNNFWCRLCVTDDTEGCYDEDTPEHCSVTKRLFAHTICTGNKIQYTRGLGLWFINTDNPLVTNWTAVAAAGLPCGAPNDVATLEAVPFK